MMKSKRKTGHDFVVRLGTTGSSANGIRRVRRDLLKLDKNRTEANKSNARELRSLSARYRSGLSELIGASGMRQLREIREQRNRDSLRYSLVLCVGKLREEAPR